MISLDTDDAKVRLALEAMPDGILAVSREGRIHFANSQIRGLLGYSSEELIGRAVEALLPERLREEHVGRRTDFWAHPVNRPMGAGKQLVGLHKNGREVPLEISLVPLAGPGEPRVLTVLRDVTAREQVEQELRASQARFAGILGIAEDAVISADADQRIILFNQGAERIFGYAAEEILGRPLEALLPQRFQEAHRGHMLAFAQAASASRKMGERREVFGRRKDGSEFPAEASISRLELKGQTIFTAMLRDVTERKRSEAAIRLLNEELEQRVLARTAELADTNGQLAQRNAENETFVYSVSHDLRSPLVNLEGFGNELALACQDLRTLLSDAALPDALRRRAIGIVDGEMAESVRYIQTAVTRLSKIIDALLRLSRAGRVVYQHQAVDVNEIVARVVQSMNATIAERGARVVVHPLRPAQGDSTAIEQVFANLIGNALNYLDPKRPGRVEVGGAPEPDGGTPGWHAYYVKDNGLGIPEAYRSKVFQAFQRLHPDRAPGEGMGLAIVRRIVERHGGQLRLESAPDLGSTFFVTLPSPSPLPLSPSDGERGRGEGDAQEEEPTS